MVLAGTLIGFGFITKMLQALILMPVLALVYLLAGPPKLGRRIVQVVYCGIALLVAGGWWVAAVQLTPAADRPYVGGSTNNSELNLIFGYNGFGRLTGNETGSVGGGGRSGGGSMWGPTGWNRLFLSSMGGQISWLIPGALIGLLAALWLTRRAPRTDRVRAGFLIFGGWLLLTGAVFSFAHGIIHPYYTVALAPAVGALVGHGGVHPVEPAPRGLPPAGPGRRHPGQHRLGLRHPRLEPDLVPGAAVGHPRRRASSPPSAIALVPRARGVLAAGIAGFGIASIIAAPAAYSLETARHRPQRGHPLGRPGRPGWERVRGPGGFGPAGAVRRWRARWPGP